jgi:hypothetical protein
MPLPALFDIEAQQSCGRLLYDIFGAYVQVLLTVARLSLYPIVFSVGLSHDFAIFASTLLRILYS